MPLQLKSVAIKLKKKLAEQTIQLNAAAEAKNKLMSEHPAAALAASKNIQVSLWLGLSSCYFW